jgi:hypothetical protein
MRRNKDKIDAALEEEHMIKVEDKNRVDLEKEFD